MSFLRSIIKKVGTACSIAKTKVINTVKKIFGINEEQKEKIKKIGKEGGIDGGNNSVEKASRIEDLLTAIAKGYRKNAETTEKHCIAIVSAQYDEFINQIEQNKDKIADTSIIMNLREKKLNVTNQISGVICKHIDRRFTRSDYECKKILKTKPQSLLESKLEEFADEVTREALEKLIVKVKGEFDEQVRSFHEILNNELEAKEKALKDKKTFIDAAVEEGYVDQMTMELNCVKPAITYDSADMVLDILK